MGKPKSTKKPRVGIVNKFSPGSKKVNKEQLKKHERREGKNVVAESAISNFIKYIAEENYAEANKYLQQVVQEKLKKVMMDYTTTPIF